MPRIIFTWELGGGLGHCVNLAPIAAGLVKRGWEVWIAARDLVTATHICGSIGIRYIQAPAIVGRVPNYVAEPINFGHILHNTGFGDDAHLTTLVNAWRNVYEFIQPDVIVCEHAPTALLAGRWSAARRVLLGTGFFSPPDICPFPCLRYWEASIVQDCAHEEETLCERVRRLLIRNDLSPIERLSQLYSQVDRAFLLTFRELDHYPQRGSAQYWGMWSWGEHQSPRWPDGDGPKVFAYLKPPSMAWNPETLLALLREVNSPTLVYMSAASANLLRKFESPRLHFATQPLELRELAQTCDLAVVNGNAGTSTALLLSGVRQLLIPLYLEQHVFSQRVVDIGAGLKATPNRPEQIACRLMAMLYTDICRDAASQFSYQYKGYDAETAISQLVDEICTLAS
jgi:hypothetical protein